MNEEILELVNEVVGVQKLRNANALVIGGIAGVSLCVGAAVGHILTKKRLQTKYADLAQQEIAEARAFYNKMAKEEIAVPGLVGLDEATVALAAYQGKDEPEVEYAVTTSNVFASPHDYDEFDVEEEMKTRTLFEPYVINHDEFMQAEPEYDQTSLTYYAGDEVLSDERDTPIEIIEETVGTANLEKFGHGSGDANTVFIRNDRLKMDFEIVKSTGKFAHEVLGFQHSDERHERRQELHKFRGVDE